MANSAYAYGVVSQIVREIKDDQTPTQAKSNTVVTVIGLVLTVLLSSLTYLAESNLDWVPLWIPQIVPFIGFLATAFGVSQTKNGVTKSTVEAVENKIAEKIDALQGSVNDPFPISLPNSDDISNTTDKILNSADSLADRFEDLAKELAKRG